MIRANALMQDLHERLTHRFAYWGFVGKLFHEGQINFENCIGDGDDISFKVETVLFLDGNLTLRLSGYKGYFEDDELALINSHRDSVSKKTGSIRQLKHDAGAFVSFLLLLPSTFAFSRYIQFEVNFLEILSSTFVVSLILPRLIHVVVTTIPKLLRKLV